MEVKAGTTIREKESGEVYKVRHVVKTYDQDTPRASGVIPAGTIVVRVETEGLHQKRLLPGTYEVVCGYCIAMQSMSLPAHATEVYMLAHHECGEEGNAYNPEFALWVRDNFSPVHDFKTTWCQVRYIRIAHLKYHHERGDTCETHENIKARMGDQYGVLMAKIVGEN